MLRDEALSEGYWVVLNPASCKAACSRVFAQRSLRTRFFFTFIKDFGRRFKFLSRGGLESHVLSEFNVEFPVSKVVFMTFREEPQVAA